MRKKGLIKFLGCSVLVLFLAMTVPVYGETVVNDTDIGTQATPYSGDGISQDAGASTVLTDDDNNITNNADIYVEDYGIHTPSGSVINNGTIFSESSAAVVTEDGDDTLENYGTITVEDSDGIGMGSGDDSFTNSGTIDIENACNFGINMCEGADTFNNSGTITIGYVENNAINMGSGDGTTGDTFINSGTIDIGSANKGIRFGTGGEDNTFTNSGTINMTDIGYHGIDFGSGDGDDILTNSGVIDIQYVNYYHAISMRSGDDTLNNSGTINIGYVNNHGIAMGSGDDILTNSGTIDIAYANCHGIAFCGGDDTFTNTGDGEINIDYAYYSGISMCSDDDTFDNSGNIEIGYAGCNGISMGSGDYADTFTNSGTITIGQASCHGIYMGSGDDSFTNSGTIDIGNANCNGICMSTGNDSFTNTGTINIAYAPNQAINMGYGNDDFTSSGALNFIGDIEGGSGIDTLTLEGTQVLSFDGDFLNFEDFTKDGTGTWALNGDVEVEDTATVTAGTLLINGTMGHHTTGPLAVTVNSTGTLGGDGTITGNVTNNGTLAPGSSIGTLTIDGDYIHEDGAVFSVEVDGTRADLLDVTGTVTGNGGTVEVTPVGVVGDGDTHDIITSDVLAGNGFDSDEVYVSPVLTFWVSAIDSDLDTEDDTVQLTAERTSYVDALDGGTPNQVSMAGVLQDTLDHPGGMEGLLLLLDTLPDEDALGEALDGLSPEHYAALSGAGIAGANLFRGVLMDRLGTFHGGLASLESDQSYANISNTLTDSGPAMANVPAPRRDSAGWSTWVRGFGGFADQNQVDDKYGYSYDTYGVAVGIDNSTGNLVLGIGAGYEATNLDHDTISAETDISTILGSIYGTYTDGRYYVDASLSYGRNNFDSERYVPLVDMTAVSDHSGNYYSAYLGTGYNMGTGGWMFVPTASLQYSHFEEDSFTESGANGANLTVAESDVDSWASRLGFRLGRMIQMGDMKVLPEISLEWACELADNDREVAARFAGVPAGESFTVEGIDPERNSALFGFALTMYASDSVTLYLNYDLELRDNFDAQAVSAGLRFRF